MNVLVDILNKYFKNEVFNYNYNFYLSDEIKLNFDYKVKVLGTKKMINIGEWRDYITVNVEIIKLNDKITELLLPAIKDRYGLTRAISGEIKDIVKFIDNDILIHIDKIEINENKNIQEQKMSKIAIRTIVKDIIKLVKNNEEGEFNLPEFDSEYQFINLPVKLRVDLYLVHNYEISNYETEAFYDIDNDVIEIGVEYNPESLNKQLYNLIGELNEIVAHEITHSIQNSRGELPKTEMSNKSNLEYYLQPHEISAQLKGFRRLSKLRNIPIEQIIIDWFETHQDIHDLNEKDKEIIIKKLINHGK
jgi:hypothetical protein